MGLIGNILTTTTGSGVGLTAMDSTINEDGTIDPKGRNGLLTTTVSTSALTTAGYIANKHGMKEINDRYATEYLESLSDEEIEDMLVKLDLLEAEKFNDNTKTI